jgi:ATP-dependent protease Clp ATPase subunit
MKITEEMVNDAYRELGLINQAKFALLVSAEAAIKIINYSSASEEVGVQGFRERVEELFLDYIHKIKDRAEKVLQDYDYQQGSEELRQLRSDHRQSV